ncbi:MAG: peptidoglycan-binding protein [Sphingomonadales bacterium]|nr:peptidoglycan-binding protein [Sphingomonadales bacterium]
MKFRGVVMASVGVCLAFAGPAGAEDAARKFAVEDGGRASCRAFLAARKDQASADYRQMIGFVEGYLTAANRYEKDTFDLSPWHSEAAFGLIFEKHCTAHPGDTLIGTLQKLTISFRPLRLAQYSRLVEVGSGKDKAIVYEMILKRAQGALRTRGLYSGAQDGRYSSAMRDALVQFQKQQKLQPTGVPDAATLWTLRNP